MERVETTLHPYCRYQDLYQSYYRAAISTYCQSENIPYRENGSAFAGLLRFLGRVRYSDRLTRIARSAVLDAVARGLGSDISVSHRVGSYIHSYDGAHVKICIDAEDPGEIAQPELLEWSDLYFKTNYWPDLAYHPKVVPLANVNPLVLTRQAELRSYRGSSAEWDLFGLFRIWGRIEHNLALFEALAQVRCRKKLVAYIISSDRGGEVSRLQKAGIDCIDRPISLKKLWELAARSRLNIVRHGVADCIPWRMTDIMAMGHCPVLDYHARTQWHVPLIEDVHYLSLDVPSLDDLSPKEYAGRIVERVEKWLSNEGLIASIGQNAAAYFDENLTPHYLGRYLVQTSRAAGKVQRQKQDDPVS